MTQSGRNKSINQYIKWIAFQNEDCGAEEVYQPSTIIHQPSTIIHQPSTIIHQPSTIIHQLSTINYQLLMPPIPFQTIDWTAIAKTEHPGETGTAYWQTVQYPGLRVRIVTYSPGYLADHWCQKGHIVHCLEGEFVSELENGEAFTLSAGMTYIVSDNLSSHRSVTESGVKLLIVDGDFLRDT
jgi:quercetin dioxygenase-like cupin family protein